MNSTVRSVMQEQSFIARVCKIVVFFFVFCALGPAFPQGSLTPPGAPAPTMKSLDQIEARTPISSLPFTISQPGSYYLTGNLTASSATDGITITADYVTVDLNGFTLTGFGTANSAIYAPSYHVNIAIRNGNVRDWGAGINLPQTENSQFENLRLYNNSAGSGLRTWHTCAIINCVARGNLNGIVTGNACIVRHCLITNNGGSGIILGAVSLAADCVSSGNITVGIDAGAGCIVRNCSASANSGDGIRASNKCLLLDNACDGNGAGAGSGSGIHTSSGVTGTRIEGNIVTNNDIGIQVEGTANIILKNGARDNGPTNNLNYVIAADNRYGTIVPATFTGTAPVNGNGPVSSTVGSDPWANFAY